MRRVIVESPLAGDGVANRKYLRRALRDCYDRNEAPIASHAIGPLVLDDEIPEERRLGLNAAIAWVSSADTLAVYRDLGITPGMQEAITEAINMGVTLEYRSIGV